jgi:uncharacterized protein
MSWLIGFTSVLVSIYLLVCLCGLLVLRRLVFPGSGPLLFPITTAEPHRRTLPTHDGVILTGWEIHRPQNRGSPVLYFGGNAEQVGLSLDKLMLIDAAWIATYSYRGYGMSEGKATFSNTVTDGVSIAQRLAAIAGCQTSDIVVMGRSLGSAVAVQVAALLSIRALVLVSPFSSLSSMTKRLAPWFPKILVDGSFNSLALISTIRVKALLILSEDDMVIPPSETETLYSACNEPKNLTRIPYGGHNGLHEHPSYIESINRFIAP